MQLYSPKKQKKSDFFLSLQTDLPRTPFSDFFIAILLQPLWTQSGPYTSLVGIFTLSKIKKQVSIGSLYQPLEKLWGRAARSLLARSSSALTVPALIQPSSASLNIYQLINLFICN